MAPDARARRRVPVSASVVAGLIAGAAIVVIVMAFLVWGSHGFKALPVSFARGLLSMGVGAAVATTHLVVGWLLVARAPRNPIGWLLLCGGLTFTLVLPIGLLVAEAHQTYRPAPGLTVALAWFQSSFGIPILGVVNLVALLLFPDGRLLSRRWWAIASFACLAGILVGLAAALDPAGIIWYPTMPNPLAAPPAFGPLLGVVRTVGAGLALVASALLVASLVFRYRVGDAIVRAQLRWIVYAGAIQVVVFSPFVVTRYVLGAPEELGEALVALGEAGSAGIPIAAAIAITRYHLFGIDVLISRTVVYLLLMAILGGAFTAVISLSQRLFVTSFGPSSDLPLVITVFLVAAAFTPVRRALEAVVDRRTRAGAAVTDPAAAATAEAEPRIAPEAGASVPAGARVARRQTSPAAATTAEMAMATAVKLTPESGGMDVDAVARTLRTVRRFEQRLSSGSVGSESGPGPERTGERSPSDGRRLRLPVDAAATVDCPRLGRVPASTCLGCEYLEAMELSPGVIVCRGGGDPVARASILD